tara:strand:+ start:101 stop:1384 length:1284 start_codon:yes stop_codon:yes gene_type:complete
VKSALRRDPEIAFLLFTAFFLVISIQLYNVLKNEKKSNFFEILNNSFFKKTVVYYLDNLNPKYENIKHKISRGETLDEILKKYQIPKEELINIKKSIDKKNKLNNLKPGLTINITIDKSEEKIINFTFPISKTKKLNLVRNLEGSDFQSREIIKNLKKEVLFKEGKITESLYKSATKSDIKPSIIIEFARIYGFEVDFQRDIRKNDSYQIVYEIFQDDQNKVYETGNIIFANLILRGQENRLYYFNKKKYEGHYDLNGKSIQKALMKTPINGARLSSSFGMRKHPILGYNKMHKGTDFAAPKGTPVMASGNGKIIKARWCGGGGNCIKIKHNSTYSTVYAHLSAFARGIKPGKRVKQGEVIGYVGSTGMSTGPHLHYEVIENGKKINSQTLKLPSGKILKNKNRELFEVTRIKTDVLISDLVAKNLN